MKWRCEIVQGFGGSYYANMTINDEEVDRLPEYVNYRTLKEAIKGETGIEIPKRKHLEFRRCGRKAYAVISDTMTNCVCCQKLRQPILRERECLTKVKGVKVRYIALIPECAVCGKPVFVPDSGKENIHRAERAYQQKVIYHDMLSRLRTRIY